MTDLVYGNDLVGRPVITLRSEDVGEVKDVVLGLHEVALVGFTLRKHAVFGGPLGQSLPWSNVHAIGRDAVMIEDASALLDGPLTAAKGRDVMGEIDVLTDLGDRLGDLVDVVIETGQPARVVGFAITVEAEGGNVRRLLVPVSEMVGVSERALVVPHAATSFFSEDLSGLDVGLEGFRERLDDAPVDE